MTEKVFWGIGRSTQYSPNSVERDAAILEGVAVRLQTAGHTVQTCNEDQWPPVGFDAKHCAAVFSMARHPEVLRALNVLAQQGVRVVNAPAALLENDRGRQTLRFQKAGVPQPESLLSNTLPTAELLQTIVRRLQLPLWLKRTDACAQTAEDVCFAADADALRRALDDFSRRGIDQVLLMAHCKGDVVKFYGVGGTGFFHVVHPTKPGGFSKYGLEVHNGPAHGYAFDVEALHAAAELASRATGISVYGGDAIVRPDGSFAIIDFNDWPSFSACVKEAAAAIAHLLARTASFPEDQFPISIS